MADAVGASSSLPIYFAPKILKNGLNRTELLLDGSLVANNPSLYAFVYASEFKKEKQIRVISIGAGATKQPTIPADEADDVNAFTWVTNLYDLIFDIEVASHAYFTKLMSEDYHRFQVMTELSLDAVDGTSLSELKELGYTIIRDNQPMLAKIIAEVCDEHYLLAK